MDSNYINTNHLLRLGQIKKGILRINHFIIRQTHYERSDWSRAFNQFTIACELDMINAISAVIMSSSSSTSAWLLSPLECSPQKQNGWTLRFCFWRWIMWKMYKKTIIEFGFRMISWIIKTSCLCYLSQPSASADNTDLGFDNSWYHAQPHPIIVYEMPYSDFAQEVSAHYPCFISRQMSKRELQKRKKRLKSCSWMLQNFGLGESGYRSRYFPHAKRALYQMEEGTILWKRNMTTSRQFSKAIRCLDIRFMC